MKTNRSTVLEDKLIKTELLKTNKIIVELHVIGSLCCYNEKVRIPDLSNDPQEDLIPCV